jgi:nitrogen fixation NifU-like protein
MADRYSPELMKHFVNPQNIGRLENSTLAATGFNESDGDGVTFYMTVEGNVLSDIKYTIKGCPRAIAASSFTSELIKGRSIEEILDMGEEMIFDALNIDRSFKCISMPLKAIQDALKDYVS